MKRWWITALIAVLPLTAFAQVPAQFPGKVDWKPGTSVTAEYKELSGTVAEDGKRLTFKAGDVTYRLLVGHKEPGADVFKAGATVSVKGIVNTVVESGKDTRYSVRPLEATADGKTVKFEAMPRFRKHPKPQN